MARNKGFNPNQVSHKAMEVFDHYGYEDFTATTKVKGTWDCLGKYMTLMVQKRFSSFPQ